MVGALDFLKPRAPLPQSENVATGTRDTLETQIPIGNLLLLSLPLDVALSNKEIPIQGDYVFVDRNSTGVGTIRFNSAAVDPFPLSKNTLIKNYKIGRAYFSCAAQPGLILNLWYGTGLDIFIAESGAASSGLTNAELRATPVPVTDAALVALDVFLSSRASEATLAARLSEADYDTKTGSLTEAAPASDTASSGLNGRLQRIAQRITSLIALLPAALVGGRLDTNIGAWLGSVAPTVGQKTMANSMPFTLASDQSTPLPAVAERRAGTLHITATAAVNTGSTATLPAAGAGLFHYITRVELKKLYSVIGVAAGAGVIITTTNMPGNPAFTTEQIAGAVGSCPTVIDWTPATPDKSSAANTATTFVAPAQLQTIWRWNISYFTAA